MTQPPLQGDTLSPRQQLLWEKKSRVLRVLRGRAGVNSSFHRCPVQHPDVIHYWGKERTWQSLRLASERKGRSPNWPSRLGGTPLHDPLLSGAPCSSLCICRLSCSSCLQPGFVLLVLSSVWKHTHTACRQSGENRDCYSSHKRQALSLKNSFHSCWRPLSK